MNKFELEEAYKVLKVEVEALRKERADIFAIRKHVRILRDDLHTSRLSEAKLSKEIDTLFPLAEIGKLVIEENLVEELSILGYRKLVEAIQDYKK